MRFGNSFKKYSPVVRLFCFTLHFYSPKSYEYLRSIFNSNLPNPRTLRYWLSEIDSSPGFTECAFDALKKKANMAKESEGKDLVVGLIYDEMYIRRHSQWDKAKKEYIGHITAGTPDEYAHFSPLANQVLLFMVCGINEDFKIPVGYFLAGALHAEEKVAMLHEAMRKLSDIGVKLASITSDGINIKVYKDLGANFRGYKPYFNNPYDIGSKVYVLLDPAHLIKLIRNCLARKKELMDGQGNKIFWRLIENLVSIQISKQINFNNKLTKTHIEFENVKMNVRIACQTISNSTASAIEFLDTTMKRKEFANSAATVKFSRTFNDLFDIMNSKKNHTDDNFKRPICAENINEITAYFDSIKEYILGLTTVEKGKSVSVLSTQSHIPFFGFLHNMNSFLGIYKDYVAPSFSGIEELYAFSLSQDHVESFFGCVRQMGGNNCNPNAQQFAAAYSKLLFKNEVTSSNVSNCQNDLTKILEVSSGKKKTPISASAAELQLLEMYDDEDVYIPSERDDEMNNHSKANLASKLEKKVIRKITLRGKRSCHQCLSVFDENEKTNDQFINFLSQRNEISQPCKSTIYIIDLIETTIEKFCSQDVSSTSMLSYILGKIDFSLLYDNSFEGLHDHKYDLTKLICETYVDMKCNAESKLVTRISQKKLLRHHRLKEVHRAGQ